MSLQNNSFDTFWTKVDIIIPLLRLTKVKPGCYWSKPVTLKAVVFLLLLTVLHFDSFLSRAPLRNSDIIKSEDFNEH